jgi:tetratricopeptide (TPR) repeat protein/predicted Ser/Thr protein kinase
VSFLALQRARERLLGKGDAPVAIGRYRITKRLGSGGMGVVYAAHDDNLDRAVAIKVLHSSTDGIERGDAWLLREAQALARLSHPNVVQVYEVGDHDEHVFLAMELVEGRTLRQWVDEDKPTVAEIVRRFVEAGRGLLAAHQANVLHRDFKPDNTSIGRDGRVRVLDFGLARRDFDESLDSRDPTLERSAPRSDKLTMSGSVMGTPRYMPPEQHAGHELTPAADQYAFCASLWGALVGAPAFAGRDVEALALAKQAGPPTWPSDAHAPRAVVSALRRGMQPEISERWPSMGDLLAALEDGISHRRRNRWLAGLAGVTVVGGVAALARGGVVENRELCADPQGSLGGAWDDARRQATRDAFMQASVGFAPATWERVSSRLDEYAESWAAQYVDNCEATRLRGEQSTALMDLRTACLQGARRELDATTQLLTTADEKTIERADGLVAALPDVQRCSDADRLLDKQSAVPDSIADAVTDIRDNLARVKALHRAGRYDDAYAELEPLLAPARGLDFAPLRAEVELALGWIQDRRGRFEDAEAADRVALEAALEAGEWDLAVQAATSLVMLVGESLEETERGLSFAPTAWGVIKRTSDPSRFEAELRRCIGAVHRGASEYDEAERELRQALAILTKSGEADPLVESKIRHSLGLALMQNGKLDEAERELRESLRVESRVVGPDHPSIAKSRMNLGAVLLKQDRLDQAEREYLDSIDALTKALGPRHPTLATARGNLASVYVLQARNEEAVAEGRQVLEIAEQSHPAGHGSILSAKLNLASYLGANGQWEDAAQRFEQMIDDLLRQGRNEEPMLASAYLGLGLQYDKLERYDDALDVARKGTAVLETLVGDEHPALAEARGEVAYALAKLDRLEEALPFAEAAWRVYDNGYGAAENRAAAGFTYAKALRATEGDLEEVRRIAEQCRDMLTDNSPRRARIVAWLDELPR